MSTIEELLAEIRKHDVTMLRNLSATGLRLSIRDAILVDYAADEIARLRAAIQGVIAAWDDWDETFDEDSGFGDVQLAVEHLRMAVGQ